MKKLTLICLFLAVADVCSAGGRRFAKDYPSMKSTFEAYKWYINEKNGAESCNNVYAFNAGNPTPDLSMIYISCDRDKSEWLIGINKKTGKPINAVPTKLYRE